MKSDKKNEDVYCFKRFKLLSISTKEEYLSDWIILNGFQRVWIILAMQQFKFTITADYAMLQYAIIVFVFKVFYSFFISTNLCIIYFFFHLKFCQQNGCKVVEQERFRHGNEEQKFCWWTIYNNALYQLPPISVIISVSKK